MARRPNLVPTYRLHRPTGQAVTTLRGAAGNRRDVYLGEYNSPASKAEYQRVIAEHTTCPAATVLKRNSANLTVNELILAFKVFAEGYYTTQEQSEYKYALRPVRELYGPTPAGSFGPIALKTVRQRMVEAGWSRGVANQRIGRVRRVFKWAVAEELVTQDVWAALTAVPGLKRGKTTARECPPVKPVPEAFVNAVRPFVSRHVWGLIMFQRLTGCRPGEACLLRWVDIDMTGSVWLFRPHTHKTAHLNRDRAIAIGPRGQELVRDFLVPDLAAYLFSPRRSMEEYHATIRSKRWTKVQPSQVSRAKARPKKAPGEHYTPCSYAQVIAKACGRAGVPAWGPNRLRHSFATEIRKRFGIEPVQSLLGHARLNTSEIYAERDMSLALRIAGEVG
jgi:integrase